MPQDVQYTEIEIPIGGQDEGVDKRILPPGKFVSVVNGDFVKPGTIRKRPGIRRVCSAFTNDFPHGDRIGRWNSQVFTFDPDETVALHQINETDETFPFLAPGGEFPIPTATVRATSVGGDLTRDVLSDVAVTSNGFLVYGLLARGDVINLTIRVIEAATNSVVMEQSITGVAADAYVRAAASGDSVLVTFSGTASPNNKLSGVVVDCSSEVPVLIGDTTFPNMVEEFATDVSGSWLAHDSAGLTVTTNRWVIAYRNASNNLKLLRVTYSGGVLSGVDVTVDSGTVSHISVIVANDGHDVALNYAKLNGSGTGSFYYAIRDETSLAAVLAPTAWHSATTVQGLATAIGKFANGLVDDFVLFASHSRNISTDSTPITHWNNASRTGVIGSSPSYKRRVFVTGKPWQRGDRQHLWTATNQGISAEDKAYTLVLISVPNQSNATYRGLTVPGAAIETTGYPQAAAPPFIQNTADEQCQPSSIAVYENVYHTCQHVLYVPFESRIGPVDCQVRYNHLGRYSNVEFGGSTYCAGGVVTEWDGTQLREVGAVHPPAIVCNVNPGAGTWGATGEYSYLAVYEYVDAQTQRHRFIHSNIEVVDIAGATDEVDILLDQLTLTRAQRYPWSATNDLQKVYVTIYRTSSPGGAFQRLFRYDLTPEELINDPTAIDFRQYTDTGEDNIANEVLYTEGGELQNDMPYGGATALCVHLDRLWLAGGIDPEVVWYSKPRVDGLPAEFAIAQSFRVPGEEVVAMGSLDEALILFCTRGIYAVFGDGPDVNGQGRPFDAPVLVNQDSACSGPRSVIQIPQGLVFQTRNGIYLLDHKRQIIYIGEPIKDTFKLFPVVRGVANNSARGELMIALSDVAGTAGTVAVYNYLQGLWSNWNHSKRDFDGLPDIAAWADISVWLNREPIFLSQSGCLYEQTASSESYSDDTLFYALDVETGWISFGRMQGYKRIRKGGVLLERFTSHGLQIKLKYGYDESYVSTFAWTPAQITAMGPVEWVRVSIPRAKTPAIRMRILETQGSLSELGGSADTKGFAIDGFAFQIGMIPGLMRLPAAQSR